jgi:hypothetical protein
MSIVVPESILEAVERVAQFTRRLTARLWTAPPDPYLEARASRASGRGWSLLEKAPRVAPIPGDELA